VTDAELQRLALVERLFARIHQSRPTVPEVFQPTTFAFLLALARRCQAAEQAVAVILQDAGIDSTRDAALIDAARRAAALECAALVAPEEAARIRAAFGLGNG